MRERERKHRFNNPKPNTNVGGYPVVDTDETPPNFRYGDQQFV